MPQPPTPTDQGSAFALSPEDVKRLLTDRTPAIRIDMTGKIASVYGGDRLNEREKNVAEQVFRLLLRDTEEKVRVTLAQHVKDSGHIPRDIVLSLARDVADVSLPVLQYSQVLNDDDLLELIAQTPDVERYLAVSQRAQVSPKVSDALIDTGHEQVAKTLVENKGAAISERGFGAIIETHGGNDALMKSVGERPRLPVAAAEKLIHLVSSSLATALREKYNLPGGEIEKEAEKTRESETLALIRQLQTQPDIDRLIGQLRAFKRLTPALILSALCEGHFEFFESSLARLADIPLVNARALITDRGELGFHAIYKKAGLPDPLFPAVKLLLRVVRELDADGEKPGTPRYANRIVERLVHYSEETAIENLSYIIALVRRVAG